MLSRRKLFAAHAVLAAATLPATADTPSYTGDNKAWVNFLTVELRQMRADVAMLYHARLKFRMDEEFRARFGTHPRVYRLEGSPGNDPRTVHLDPSMVQSDEWLGSTWEYERTRSNHLSIPVAIVFDNGAIKAGDAGFYYSMPSVADFVAWQRTPIDVSQGEWAEMKDRFLERARRRHAELSHLLNEVS